jgi:hypothetical protein
MKYTLGKYKRELLMNLQQLSIDVPSADTHGENIEK